MMYLLGTLKHIKSLSNADFLPNDWIYPALPSPALAGREVKSDEHVDDHRITQFTFPEEKSLKSFHYLYRTPFSRLELQIWAHKDITDNQIKIFFQGRADFASFMEPILDLNERSFASPAPHMNSALRLQKSITMTDHTLDDAALECRIAPFEQKPKTKNPTITHWSSYNFAGVSAYHFNSDRDHEFFTNTILFFSAKAFNQQPVQSIKHEIVQTEGPVITEIRDTHDGLTSVHPLEDPATVNEAPRVLVPDTTKETQTLRKPEVMAECKYSLEPMVVAKEFTRKHFEDPFNQTIWLEIQSRFPDHQDLTYEYLNNFFNDQDFQTLKNTFKLVSSQIDYLQNHNNIDTQRSIRTLVKFYKTLENLWINTIAESCSKVSTGELKTHHHKPLLKQLGDQTITILDKTITDPSLNKNPIIHFFKELYKSIKLFCFGLKPINPSCFFNSPVRKVKHDLIHAKNLLELNKRSESSVEKPSAPG